MKERVMVDSNGRKYITTEPEPKNKFNPDWDAIAIMVDEQQRMAKRIEELTKLVTSQGIRLMDSEAQPKKEWVGLTDGDVNYCVDAIYKGFDMKPKNEIEIEYFERVIKFVEAKLKEKNT